MLKLRASDLAMRMATDAVQLYGGYGYCKDYRVERLMRDAKITQIWEGTNQIHRQLIGRSFMTKRCYRMSRPIARARVPDLAPQLTAEGRAVAALPVPVDPAFRSEEVRAYPALGADNASIGG